MKTYLLYHQESYSVKVKISPMNVCMTRARRKLLLVGDSSTLCRHPFFGELLAYVKGVGGYRMAQTVVL